METQRLVYSVEEAGRLLALGRSSAYTMARTGQLPTLRFGKRLVVPKAALERMLNEAGNNGDGNGRN